MVVVKYEYALRSLVDYFAFSSALSGTLYYCKHYSINDVIVFRQDIPYGEWIL